MNIEYWIDKLAGDDPLAALMQLQRFTSSQLRGAVSALLKLIEQSDFALACQAAQLAIRIEPQQSDQLASILKFLLNAQPCGWMLPDVVDSFEQLAARQPEVIEQLGEAITYPHYRVRIAAVRGLASMGELLEFVKQPLLAAIEDPSGSVVEAVVRILQDNRSFFSADLSDVLSRYQINQTSHAQDAESKSLEQLLWRPRAGKLNGLGEDGEDAIFFLRNQSQQEKELSENERLEQLLTSHNLPPAVSSLRRIAPQETTTLLLKMMCPVFSNEPICNEPIELFANRLCDFFDKNVRIYSNVVVQNGLIEEYQPVAFGLIDNGLLWVDDERVGMFWVVDED